MSTKLKILCKGMACAMKRAVIFAALCGIFLASCQSHSSSPEKALCIEHPEWRTGDAWDYRITTTPAHTKNPASIRVSHQVIQSIQDGNINISARDGENGKVLNTVWNTDGDVMRSSIPGQPEQIYEPPLSFHRWPSTAGQRWSFSYRARTGYGQVLYAKNMEFNVVGWETITVPAGTYRVLRTEISGSSPDGELSSTATSWFSPQIKRRVRFEEKTYVGGEPSSTIVHELLSFTPG